MFAKYDVLSERELESRYEVSLEQYVTTVNIEGETAAAIARTMLLPAAVQWLRHARARPTTDRRRRLKDELGELLDEFVEAIFALETANRDHPEDGTSSTRPSTSRRRCSPRWRVREVADRLERIVPDDLWPLPKYSEILFIK